MDLSKTDSLTAEKSRLHIILLFPYADILEGVTFSQHDICFQKWDRRTTNKTFTPYNNKTITSSLNKSALLTRTFPVL